MDYIYGYISYKKSRKVFRKEMDPKQYLSEHKKTLEYISDDWPWFDYYSLSDIGVKVRKNSALQRLFFILDNDLRISEESFFHKLYFKIFSYDWFQDTEMNESKRDFMRGFFESRGSIDTTRPYLSQDYFYNSKFELEKAKIFLDYFQVPPNYLNINFRQLQNDYLSGKVKRNTQLRLNVHWFAHEVGFINKYKAIIYEKVYRPERKKEKSPIVYYYHSELDSNRNKNLATQFYKYVNFFGSNILQKDLSKQETEILRRELGFNSKSQKNRSQSLKDLFFKLSPDKCGLCGTTNTYTTKNSNGQGFEIHHVISLENDPDRLDHIDNLVKLCPTCHAKLKKGRALFAEQVNSNKEIIKKHRNIYDFTGSYFEVFDYDKLAYKITEHLK